MPIVWIRNILGSFRHDADGPDGTCTFASAIDTVIEVDYLLSQAGRGLKYGSDSTLVLKDPSAGFGGGSPARVGGVSSALTLPPEGDAKLLEINGNAAAAVLAHVKELRAIALEAMHGNRAHGDRGGTAPSGRAIELMCQGFIWLADRLRISYGEGGLLLLLRMVRRASCKLRGGLIVGGSAEQDLDAGGADLAKLVPGDVSRPASSGIKCSHAVERWRHRPGRGIPDRRTIVRAWRTDAARP